MINALIYSNLFVAIVLCALTSSSYLLIANLEFKWYVCLSVFMGSFVLYTFHRIYKIDYIPPSRLAERHRWILKRSVLMKYLMSFAVLILMVILPNFNADTIVWLIPAGLVSLGYTIPIIPSRNGWKRFRDIPLSKPLIISLVVSYLTLGYPIFEQFGIEAVFSAAYFPIMAERILFLLVVTIPFEVRDIVNDKDAGLKTIGTNFGMHKARMIALSILAIWLLMMVWRMYTVGFAIGFVLMPLFVVALVISAIQKMNSAWSDIRYSLVFEGLILFYAIASALSSSFH